MTGPQAPENGPFATRQAAERIFSAFRRAAERGRAGPDLPRGEQIVLTGHQWKAEALTDTIELWAEIGDYDRVVIAKLAGVLDPVEVGVVTSWFYRVMRDQYDNPANQEGH